VDHGTGCRSDAVKGQRRHKRGNKYVGAALGETPVAAGKTGTREGARHRKISRKRSKAKACLATGNTQIRVFAPCCPTLAPAARTSAPTGTTANARPPGGSAAWSGS
jgi:hypothetical protein